MKIFKSVSIAALAFIAIGTIGILTGDSAFAVTKTYVGISGGSFSGAGNWSPTGIPANNDDIIINNATTSSMYVVNNIPSLVLNSVTFNGTGSIAITNDTNVTSLGVTSAITSSGDAFSSISGAVTLQGDVTVTNMSPATSVNLNNHALTYVTNSTYPQSTISSGVISGNGTLNVDVRNTISFYFNSANTYSGTTNIVTGVIDSSDGNSLGDFGTSTINVSPTASLTLTAIGAAWSFPNTITIAPATVGQSGYVEAQLYVWATQPNQAISIPNITLGGNARFDINDAGGASGSTVDLAGINAGTFCVQYGTENVQADQFLNGPAACAIGDDGVGATIGVPNTAAAFVKANPAIVAVLGVITAVVLVAIALRSKTIKK